MEKILKTLIPFIVLLGLSTAAFCQDEPMFPNGLHPDSPPMEQPGGMMNLQEKLKTILGTMVIDGKLGLDPAIQTLAYYNKEQAAMKDMTPEGRQHDQEKSRADHQDFLSLLIKDNVLTKKQAKAIEKNLAKQISSLDASPMGPPDGQNPPPSPTGDSNHGGPPSGSGQPNQPDGPKIKQPGLKDTLGILVIDKTIDRDQALKILTYYKKENAKTQKDPEHKELLNQLIKNSIITESQAQAIKEAFYAVPRMSSPKGKPENSGQSSVKTAGFYTQSGNAGTMTNQTMTTAKKDESAIKVSDKGTFTLWDSAVSKTGESSSEEDSNFYGLNAGILGESAARINLADCTINTDARGANAVFATGTGSLITLTNITINTKADSSRGLDATLKGKIQAKNVTIHTVGDHCAALATDRGNGTIIVDGSTASTEGEGSPCIYSTGDIQVSNSKLTATGSEGAVIEGKNSISLNNVTLSGAKARGVMVYQSFSGDAEVGAGVFTMDGGSLTSVEGPLFYATNTQAKIEIKNVVLHQTAGILLFAGADRWGNQGSNGATVTFKADSETLAGNVSCDGISSIYMILQNNTAFTGGINAKNTAKSLSLELDKTSSWNVKENSYLTSFKDGDPSLANIHDHGFTIYYDNNSSSNNWLQGKTYDLPNGGKLAPEK